MADSWAENVHEACSERNTQRLCELLSEFLIESRSEEFSSPGYERIRKILSITDFFTEMESCCDSDALPCIFHFTCRCLEISSNLASAKAGLSCHQSDIVVLVLPFHLSCLQFIRNILNPTSHKVEEVEVVLLLNCLRDASECWNGLSTQKLFNSSTKPDLWMPKWRQQMIALHRLLLSVMLMVYEFYSVSLCDVHHCISLEILKGIIEDISSKAPLAESNVVSLASNLLKCIHNVLLHCKTAQLPYVNILLQFLRPFLTYGLPQFPSSRTGSQQAVPYGPNGQKRSAYVPPHLRRKRTEVDDSVGWSSESDQSDSDSSGKEGGRTSRLRLWALLSIQAMAKQSPKSLHAHWKDLLPTHDVLNPRPYQPTVLTAVLFDPLPRVRLAAVHTVLSMLDGPLRPFLQLAEGHKPSIRPASFTSMSGTLSQILEQMHTCLLHSVLTEAYPPVICSSFNALSVLAMAAPYGRLSPQILPAVVNQVHQRVKAAMDGLNVHEPHSVNVLCAAIACLGSTLSATSSNHNPTHPPVHSFEESMADSPLLHDLIACLDFDPPICSDAINALRQLVQHRAVVASTVWQSLSNIHGFLSLTAGEPKTAHLAVKLLDDILRVSFGGSSPIEEDALSMEPAGPASMASESEAEPCGPDGQQMWMVAHRSLLSAAKKHPAANVRAAALSCYSGMTPELLISLPPWIEHDLVNDLIQATNDDSPAVRSAACHSLAVISSLQNYSLQVMSRLWLPISTLQHLACDPSVQVRVSVHWGLATICASFKSSNVRHGSHEWSEAAMAPLAHCALQACADTDKVRCNAVRTLGNLALVCHFRRAGHGGSEELSWLDKMCDAMIHVFSGGSAKAQWNACHGLSNLFQNASVELSKREWAPSILGVLVDQLSNSHFKVRIQAAHALSVPASLSDYADSLSLVVKGTLSALLATLGSGNFSERLDFKYKPLLELQLWTTLVHIFELAGIDNLLSSLPLLRQCGEPPLSALLKSRLQTICSSDVLEQPSSKTTHLGRSILLHRWQQVAAKWKEILKVHNELEATYFFYAILENNG